MPTPYTGGLRSVEPAAADVRPPCQDPGMLAPDGPQPQHPFVACVPPIAVRVLHDDGCWYDGEVTNFTGPRINVRFATEPGSTYWYVVPPELVQLLET